MFEDVQTPKDIEDKMKEFRDTSCSGISAVQFSEFARRVESIIPREGGYAKRHCQPLGRALDLCEIWTKAHARGN